MCRRVDGQSCILQGQRSKGEDTVQVAGCEVISQYLSFLFAVDKTKGMSSEGWGQVFTLIQPSLENISGGLPRPTDNNGIVSQTI